MPQPIIGYYYIVDGEIEMYHCIYDFNELEPTNYN